VKQTATTAVVLTGRWHAVAHLAWSALILLCFLLLVYSLVIVPPIIQQIRQQYTGLAAVLASLPLLRRYLLLVAFYAISVVAFRQRSHELGPLIMTALYIAGASVPLATGVFSLTAGVMAVPPLLNALAVMVLSLAVFVSILSVHVFPDGRFVPPQARWTIIPTLVLGVSYAIAFYRTQAIPLPVFWLAMGGILSGVLTQVYRYRSQENSTQRQQIKWFVYGAVFFLIAQPTAALLQRQIGPLDSLPALLRNTVAELLFFTSYLAILLTNAIAIVRYRLYDINYVINRSIVFAGLTLLLGGLFAGVFWGLQLALAAVIGSEQQIISAGIAGALVILIFQPTRRQVRRLVDRRLYGIELNYTEVDQPKPIVYTAHEVEKQAGTFADFKEMVVIGRGGMGEVYRAIDVSRQMTVAIKLLKETGEADLEARRRFRREAQTIARLRHPHIVTLYEIGEHEGMLYMVMEYIAGQTVYQLLRDHKRLSLSETATIVNHIAAALDFAHTQNVIHRDIKPANVIVEQNTGRAVLMDFGIAKIAAATQLTHTGGVIGTLDYIAPEQIQGSPLVDQRADIYALGVTTYQMLTGELPFKHNNPGALIMAHLMQPPPDARDKAPDLPENVAAAVIRAMSKEPADRFATAGELAAQLQVPYSTKNWPVR
jgi:hypothetical protein